MDREIGKYWVSNILKTVNIKLIPKEISYNEVISIEIAVIRICSYFSIALEVKWDDF